MTWALWPLIYGCMLLQRIMHYNYYRVCRICNRCAYGGHRLVTLLDTCLFGRSSSFARSSAHRPAIYNLIVALYSCDPGLSLHVTHYASIMIYLAVNSIKRSSRNFVNLHSQLDLPNVINTWLRLSFVYCGRSAVSHIGKGHGKNRVRIMFECLYIAP